MPWDLRPVDLELFDTAPMSWAAAEVVNPLVAKMFASLAGDPEGWGAWFPGFSCRLGPRS